MLEDVIDNDEYLEIKVDCKDQIDKLESKPSKVEDKKKIDFPKLLDQALSNLVNLSKVYADGDIEVKRKIVGSMFPEKLEFFENHYRTTKANVLLSYIYQINNELGAKKNRKESELSPLSGLVPITEEISKHLVEDLERISEILPGKYSQKKKN